MTADRYEPGDHPTTKSVDKLNMSISRMSDLSSSGKNDMNGFRHQVVALAALIVLSTGCHCMPCTEKHADMVDDLSDRCPWADKYYHAKLDLTRLGRSDGPEWYRHQCCR